jgi:hypothetical protein
MMSRLKVDTSLFKPIEVEINGKVYQAVRMTRPVERQMVELDKLWADGDIDVPRRRLTALLGDHPEFDDLDISEVHRIIGDIFTKAYGPPALTDTEDEKKVAAPGETA